MHIYNAKVKWIALYLLCRLPYGKHSSLKISHWSTVDLIDVSVYETGHFFVLSSSFSENQLKFM